MRLLDLFRRSRPRYAPRPRPNRVRCAVELLEARLVLSSTDGMQTAPVVQPTFTNTVTAILPTAPPTINPVTQ